MILVTGATGNVGRELVKQLIGKGARVRILVRDERKAASLDQVVERAVGDLDKPETLDAALQGIDRLYIVTPDTRQVTNLVQAAKVAGVRYIVKQSTIEAGRSLGPGKWHHEQEKLIEASGLEWTFLRPTMFMVNTIEWWSDTIKSQKAVYFPGGKGKAAPVDSRDVARVACAVLTQPGHAGKVYELTGPQVLSIPDMVGILAQAIGQPIRYVNVPAFIAGMWMRRSGLPGYVVKGLMETLGALRRNEYAYLSEAVERVGGCTPRSYEEWCCENSSYFV